MLPHGSPRIRAVTARPSLFLSSFTRTALVGLATVLPLPEKVYFSGEERYGLTLFHFEDKQKG
jgi:hypothetical protein